MAVSPKCNSALYSGSFWIEPKSFQEDQIKFDEYVPRHTGSLDERYYFLTRGAQQANVNVKLHVVALSFVNPGGPDAVGTLGVFASAFIWYFTEADTILISCQS